jgi:uncharacterized protein
MSARADFSPQHVRDMPPFARAMMRPEFYPERPARVELRETHISRVFIAGDFVYKTKKAVHFSFIEAAALARRFELCRAELILNARLARGIYLAVVPILHSSDGYALGGPCEHPVAGAVEYAVKMRRLDDDAMLERRVVSGRLEPSAIRAIAKRLAEFHASAARDKSWQYGSAAAVWRLVIGNLAECESFIGAGLERGVFDELDKFCRGAVTAQWELINARARGGKVCDGHGDLRAEHVSLEGGRIDVIDCVEFNESLRYGDVALDAAFLAMDLDRLGARPLSREFVRAYIDVSRDDDLASVLPLYKCHRAIVRAKVASIAAGARGASSDEIEKARAKARKFFALALEYAQSAARALIVICGRSGTGKSTLARVVRERTGFIAINSDRVRKQHAGLAPEAVAHEAYGRGIYSESSTRATYDTMLAEAERELSQNRGVILDATYKDRAERRNVLELARRLAVPLLFVECRADEAEVLRRLRARASDPKRVSDADAAVYHAQGAEFMPLSEIPARNRIAIDSTRDPDVLGDEIQSALAAVRASEPQNG